MRQPLIIILLNLNPFRTQRLPHDLPIIPQWIKLTRSDIRRGEIRQILLIQRREVRFILGIHTRQFVELHHGRLVDDGHVLRVLRVRFVV